MEWKIAGELPSLTPGKPCLGYAGPLAGTDKNVLVIAGGANFPEGMPWTGGRKKYYSEGYLFARQGDSLTFFSSFQLPYSIAYPANCSTPLGIVSAGGENETGLSKRVIRLQYEPSERNVHITDLPELPIALSNAAMTCHKGTIYLAGGETASGVSARVFSLELDRPEANWKELSPLPFPVSHTLLVAQSAGLFIIGGRMKQQNDISRLYREVYFFDPAGNQWIEKTSLPHDLSAHCGLSFGDDDILVFGGDDGKTFHDLEQLNLSITNEKSTQKLTKLNERKTQILTSHSGFSKEVLVYNTRSNEWKAEKDIPYMVPLTTTAVKLGDEVVLPGGEIRPGVRSPFLLMGKLKAN